MYFYIVLTLFYSLTSTDSAGGGRSAFTPRGISFTMYVQNPSTQHSLVNLVYKGQRRPPF